MFAPYSLTQMPSACGYPPVTGTGSPSWLMAPSNALGRPSPGTPGQPYPTLPWLLGRIHADFPLGSRKFPGTSQTSFSQHPTLSSGIYGKQQGIAFLENFFIVFLNGNILLLILDRSVSVCWQILASFTLGKVKPAEQLTTELELCSCKIHLVDPTQQGDRDLCLGTQQMTSD